LGVDGTKLGNYNRRNKNKDEKRVWVLI